MMTTPGRSSSRQFVVLLLWLLVVIAENSADVQDALVVVQQTSSVATEEGGECSASDETCAAPSNSSQGVVLVNDNVASSEAAVAVVVDDDNVVVGLLCADDNIHCLAWANDGECEKNPSYMTLRCRKACNHCSSEVLDLTLGEDIGEIQLVGTEGAIADQVLDRIQKARDYLVNHVYADPSYDSVKHVCRNRNESCAYWAVMGECDNNARYMNMSCGPVCQSCEFISLSRRCPLDPNATHMWANPGDLNAMFERITTQPEFQTYEPTVLSRPELVPGDTTENATYLVGGPWVVTLENFLSLEEANRFIEIGADHGYKRSSDVGEINPDGTYEGDINEGRTSTNAWCNRTCASDPVIKPVLDRMEHVTMIPDNFTEHLQLLRYEVGQYYQTHHDYIEFDVGRQGGVRILTFFLYLNDVEEGGGTNFPELNLTVMPKLGRVLIWPSVLNEDPDAIDDRTLHQALPVIRGLKYGANAWMHRRDYKAAKERNC